MQARAARVRLGQGAAATFVQSAHAFARGTPHKTPRLRRRAGDRGRPSDERSKKRDEQQKTTPFVPLLLRFVKRSVSFVRFMFAVVTQVLQSRHRVIQ